MSMVISMNIFQNKWVCLLLRQVRDILITFLISIVVTYFFAGNRLFTSFHTVFWNCLYGFAVGITVWKGNAILGYSINRIFPWDKKPKRTLAISILTSIAYSALAILVVNVLFYNYIFHLSIRNWQVLIQMVVEMGVSLLITTIFYFKEFFIAWRSAVISSEKYKQEVMALQYETLKSYVNPHFLFNSLSILSSLVEKNTAKSQEFIKQLSDIYRYVLEQKDKELVLLETELNFVNAYINLHRIRHGENLKVDLRVNDASGYIIPLSMQIALENALKHNIISEEEPLEVKVWRENGYIIVQNRLQIRNVINEVGGIGLETISKRYAFFTERPLLVNSDNGFFTVKLPVLDLSVLDSCK